MKKKKGSGILRKKNQQLWRKKHEGKTRSLKKVAES